MTDLATIQDKQAVNLELQELKNKIEALGLKKNFNSYYLNYYAYRRYSNECSVINRMIDHLFEITENVSDNADYISLKKDVDQNWKLASKFEDMFMSEEFTLAAELDCNEDEINLLAQRQYEKETKSK